ncbi:MAG: isoleucine--tRNA ligase, partial [Nitrospiria bacterium]
DETALAEAEVEYADHTSPSIYVKFPVKSPGGKFQLNAQRGTYFVIWTTTPWTLLANQAVALHPSLTYRLVNTQTGQFILAQDLIEVCMKRLDFDIGTYQVTDGAWAGRELEGVVCHHPWLDRSSSIVLGEHVTLDQGTGCVHTAPGHGQEDYEVGLCYGLDVYAPVDHQGRFMKEAGPFFGQKVFEANQAIIDLLKKRGMLLKEETITHSYPHCWRCKNPVIFRATEQWFISMEAGELRERATHAIENDIQWIPKWGKERILGMMETRPDWCISRQRVWGVPIVAFTCLDCKEVLVSREIADYVADQMEKEGGSDLWFSKSAEALLPEGTQCHQCQGNRFKKEGDILDVWFESGVSHAAVLKRRSGLKWPADLYLEGSDQHRGWFQSTLLASLKTDRRAPYKAVLTHGFTVDGSGKKMSKSSGNVIAPQEVINKHGAEILRLWVAATDFREDVRISPDILTQLVEAYRKIRNTCRFLLGNLYDYLPGDTPFPEDDLLDIDRWALDRLRILNEKVQRAYRTSEFHIVFHALNNFCAVDLSSFYLDILKDRLYTAASDAPARRAAQAVMQEILLTLIRLMAPILSFTADEIWQYLPSDFKTGASVHLTLFPEVKERIFAKGETWARLIRVRDEVSRVLEEARKEKKIGNPLEAGVTLFAKPPLFDLLKEQGSMLPSFFIVSQVDLFPWQDENKGEWKDSDINQEKAHWTLSSTIDQEGLVIKVSPARGEKCERCWTYQESVGRNVTHPTLCQHCTEVVNVGSIDAG